MLNKERKKDSQELQGKGSNMLPENEFRDADTKLPRSVLNKKLYIRLFIVFIILILLSGCCITLGLDELGNKHIFSRNVTNAAHAQEDIIYLTTDTSVSYGQYYTKTKDSNDTILLKCNINSDLKETKNISKDILDKKFSYYSSDTVEAINNLKTEHMSIYAGKPTHCKFESDESVLGISNKINIINDDLNNRLNIDKKGIYISKDRTRYYNKEYYKIYYILLNHENNSMIVTPINTYVSTSTTTAYRPIRNYLYPLAIALDVITFPIQMLTREPAPRHTCPGCTKCPLWTQTH